MKRTKCIAKEELKKLENNDKLSLKQIYNGKIMEVQQKYQEDMADIGQAHTSAALEPDYDALIKEKQRKNKIAALKRGKEARKQIKNTQQVNYLMLTFYYIVENDYKCSYSIQNTNIYILC